MPSLRSTLPAVEKRAPLKRSHLKSTNIGFPVQLRMVVAETRGSIERLVFHYEARTKDILCTVLANCSRYNIKINQYPFRVHHLACCPCNMLFMRTLEGAWACFNSPRPSLQHVRATCPRNMSPQHVPPTCPLVFADLYIHCHCYLFTATVLIPHYRVSVFSQNNRNFHSRKNETLTERQKEGT